MLGSSTRRSEKRSSGNASVRLLGLRLPEFVRDLGDRAGTATLWADRGEIRATIEEFFRADSASSSPSKSKFQSSGKEKQPAGVALGAATATGLKQISFRELVTRCAAESSRAAANWLWRSRWSSAAEAPLRLALPNMLLKLPPPNAAKAGELFEVAQSSAGSGGKSRG